MRKGAEICPRCHCSEPHLSFGELGMEEEVVWQTMKCKCCRFRWNIVWKYWRCENADTCEEIDENGNIVTNITLEPLEE